MGELVGKAREGMNLKNVPRLPVNRTGESYLVYKLLNSSICNELLTMKEILCWSNYQLTKP